MRKTAVNIARLLLAVVFILSGFVKAVDPLGTQYKTADYLTAMHLGQYVPDFVTLGFAVLLSALEFVMGVCLLFAIRRRMVSKLVLLLMKRSSASFFNIAVKYYSPHAADSMSIVHTP